MIKLEQELRMLLEEFATSRANDIELHQSTEHSYQFSIARIEKAFEKAGYKI